MRRTISLFTAFAVTAVYATLVVAGAQATGASPSIRAGSHRSAAPSPGLRPVPGTSTVFDLGAQGWLVQSSAEASQPGTVISSPRLRGAGWLKVRNDDAGAPGTELEALAQNGRCPGDPRLQPVNQRDDSPRSIFFSTNMRRCYGYLHRIGRDTLPLFDVPWWWRTGFVPRLRPGQHAKLILNGVIGAGHIWLNGQRVGTVDGAYTRDVFDITPLLRAGRNELAIEVQPNNPNTMFTLDGVDWNQIPPDNNTGIQFPVQLSVADALSGGNSRVLEDSAQDLSRSALTIATDVTNNTDAPQAGEITATISPPGAGAPITIRQRVTVPAATTRTVSLTPARYPRLIITHPRVWWPYQLGAQPLYRLTTSVSQHGTPLSSSTQTFGIRTVTSYLTGSSPAEPSGTRAFKINGVPIVIRGGGFAPSLFLHYSAADTARQIALMKNLGVNAIRLEGHIMPEAFFEQMDRAGILVNAGYQCCDAWQLQDSGLTSAADYAIMRLSALTIGQNLRNHPSVFSFQWSDDQPLPRQESVTLAAFRQAGFTDPVISSAEYISSPQLGISGEKEGPYDWVPPSYWYDTTHYDRHDRTQTNAGGAWGYDSEQSGGDTIPTLDSLRRFMSSSDLAQLWRNPAFNQYHANYEPRCQTGYSFGTLCHFDTALRRRYGAWPGLSQYVEEAQAQNYEDTRAQFEAFIAHAHQRPLPSTGTIYWQMNKGWPSLLWTLYGSDGDQAGSYFGAREADRPLHALYALDSGTVALDNLGLRPQSGVSVESRVFSLGGRLLDERAADGITLASQQVRTRVLTPRVPAGHPTRVYFVELLLRQHGTVVDRNVYWLSTRHDVVNWGKTLGQPQAIMSSYASLAALHTLSAAQVTVTAATARRPGPAGADRATTLTITNTSPGRIAFLLRADVRRGTRTGHVLPGDSELRSAIWQGNDITLFPGESQRLTVTYDSAGLRGATPVITVSGWDTRPLSVPAPAR
jgi:exo-1,4-beta-D-glucosaminidase